MYQKQCRILARMKAEDGDIDVEAATRVGEAQETKDLGVLDLEVPSGEIYRGRISRDGPKIQLTPFAPAVLKPARL
jgi:hypothetical protein